MGLHGGIARPDMVGEYEGDRRRLPAVFAAAFQRQAHGVGMGCMAIEGLEDRGLKLVRAIMIKPPDQRSGDGAEVMAALGDTGEQGLARRRRLGQTVGGPLTACASFLVDQLLEMGGFFDLFAFAVAAPMAGDDAHAVDDAQPVGIGQHGQRSLDMGVGHRIIVEVEADIGCLADLDRYLFDHRVGIVR